MHIELKISEEKGGKFGLLLFVVRFDGTGSEAYVKRLDGYTHLYLFSVFIGQQ